MVFFGALHLESLTGFTRDVCYFGMDKAFSGLWHAIGHQRAACMQHVTRAVAEQKTNRTRKTPFKPSDNLFLDLVTRLVSRAPVRILVLHITYIFIRMANNSTAYILPQWLLAKEPGMTCRPHGTIIGMLAVYNVVSTLVSVITAGPFFYKQKQQLWNWKRRIFDRFLPFLSCVPSREEHSY
jgi:hypothetical protein